MRRESKVEIGNDGGGSSGEQGGRDAGDLGIVTFM